ncbi:MAG TPA: general secretion pathway protein GspB [Tepidisphaeraceae bacterium]|jgi:hypothetical protein|nr:general secretion pathway protein GspB [Tepidisphaeraceae bacterium]
MTQDNTKTSQEPAGEGDEGQTAKTPAGGVPPGTNRYVNWGFCMVAVTLLAAFLYLRRGPQSAGAAPSTSVAFETRLSSELALIKNIDRALSTSGKVVEQFKFVPAKVQVPLRELKVNPFHQSGAEAIPTDAQDEQTAGDLLEKERLAALAAVQSLRLQSIIHGAAQRTCMINSTRYHEGQEAGGFLIEEIASNTVVVRKGVYRFELKPSM